jgi:uncharacterized phage protein (TIGR01671 family)
MRQIKFRVWDTDKQRFIWTGFENFLSETHEDKLHDVRQGRMVLNADWSGMGSRCVFQEFTGKKDKNGKEIFEGDICSTYNIDEPSNLTDTVVFDEGSFVFQSDYKLSAELRGFKSDYIEVIGNIYETPELIGK